MGAELGKLRVRHSFNGVSSQAYGGNLDIRGKDIKGILMRGVQASNGAVLHGNCGKGGA